MTVIAGAAPCLHCGLRSGGRPRGLCHTCYDDRAIRLRYDHRPASRRWLKQYADHYDDLPPPETATGAMPGTPEKVEVLAWRQTLGFALWHPLDVQEDVSG